VHGLHHSLEYGVEHLPSLFRIAIGEQLHGAFEIGEEHGDLLAFTFEGALGVENLLGEMLGSIGLGGS